MCSFLAVNSHHNHENTNGLCFIQEKRFSGNAVLLLGFCSLEMSRSMAIISLLACNIPSVRNWLKQQCQYRNSI
jgi:hypothetical protein